MKKLSFVAQLALALVLVLSLLAILQGVVMSKRPPARLAEATVECKVELDPALIAAGEKLYAQNCAACHGATLEGAPDWEQRHPDGSFPPPPLNSAAHAWQHSDSSIVFTITNGRSAGKSHSMPAFGDRLSTDEVRAVIEFIKSHWGASELNQQDLLNQ